MSRWEELESEGQVLARFKNALANALDQKFRRSEGDYGGDFERKFAIVHGSPYGAASNIRRVLYDITSRGAMALALEHLFVAAAQVPTEYGAWSSYLAEAAEAVSEVLKHHPAMNLRLVKVGEAYEIHPAGAADLDVVIVDKTVDWLEQYPAIQQEARRALTATAEGDAAEGLNAARVALEMLIRAVTSNSKSLENQIGASAAADAPLTNWLREKGVKPHAITMAYRIVTSVTDFQNAWVKHPPAGGVTFVPAEVQFELYAVFNLMHLLAGLANG